MKIGEVFPSNYLKGDDITEETPVIIARMVFEKMKDSDGQVEEKAILYFKGMDKGIVLNRTNGYRIAEQWGDDTDLWIGKRITLTTESVTAFGKTSWAIRVKPERKMPGAAVPVAQAPAAAPKVETEESKKERFLGLFNILGLYATPVFKRNGLILDTEVWRDISPSKVAAMTRKNVDALLDEVKLEAGAAMPPEDSDIGF